MRPRQGCACPAGPLPTLWCLTTRGSTWSGCPGGWNYWRAGWIDNGRNTDYNEKGDKNTGRLVVRPRGRAPVSNLPSQGRPFSNHSPPLGGHIWEDNFI